LEQKVVANKTICGLRSSLSHNYVASITLGGRLTASPAAKNPQPRGQKAIRLNAQKLNFRGGKPEA